MYAAGHPILYAVAAFSFMISYAVDKAALLRMYRRPPMFDGAMALFSVSVMPYAAVIHLVIAIWMYSESTVLYSPLVFGKQASDVASITGKDVSNNIGNFLTSASAEDSTGLNFVSRLTRENTLPLFILLCVYVFGWMLYITAGKALLALMRQCCYCMSRGRCCKEKHGLRDLQWNPPWTGPYSLPLDPRKEHVLTKFEERAGWRIVKDNRGHVVKIRQWPRDGLTFGLVHRKGQRMLTWQVVAHQGIASYDIAANPYYSFAGRAVADARAKAAEKRLGKKSTKSIRALGAAATSGMLKPSMHHMSAAGSMRMPAQPAGEAKDEAPVVEGQEVQAGVYDPNYGFSNMGYDPYAGYGMDPYQAYNAGGYGYGGYGAADPGGGYYAGYDQQQYGYGATGGYGYGYGGGMGMDPGALSMMGFDPYTGYPGAGQYGMTAEMLGLPPNDGDVEYGMVGADGSAAQSLALVNPNEYGDVDESGGESDEDAQPVGGDKEAPITARIGDEKDTEVSRAHSRGSSGSRRHRSARAIYPDELLDNNTSQPEMKHGASVNASVSPHSAGAEDSSVVPRPASEIGDNEVSLIPDTTGITHRVINIAPSQSQSQPPGMPDSAIEDAENRATAHISSADII
jgi:hypothetical protein